MLALVQVSLVLNTVLIYGHFKMHKMHFCQWSQKHPEIDMSGLTADGYWGFITENAIKEFQRANGLEVDGRIGDATKLELLPYYLEFENCTPP